MVKRFAKTADHRWLTDDLAYELAARGNRVDVLLLDASGSWEDGIFDVAPNVRVISHRMRSHGSRGGLLSTAMVALRWVRAMLRPGLRRRPNEYDHVVNFSIASLFIGLTYRLKRRNIRLRSTLIIWDFFPTHHQQIGKVKSGLIEKILYRLERLEVMTHDCVGVMSERNKEFFHSYFPGYRGAVVLIPIWGRDVSFSAATTTGGSRMEKGPFRAIFGGQIVRGRGIETLVEVAEICQARRANIEILIVGDGELRSHLERMISVRSVRNVRMTGRVNRDTYMSILLQCDIGLVVTVPGVTVPTFPSKVIDYMAASKPVLACVEESSDFGSFVETEARCGFSVTAGDARHVADVLCQLASGQLECDLIEMGRRGNEYFKRYMTVSSAVDRIELTAA